MPQVPDNYLRAIFGSFLASRYIYEYGVSASQFSFFDFMSKRVARSASN
jgi:glutamate dehydrogenase